MCLSASRVQPIRLEYVPVCKLAWWKLDECTICCTIYMPKVVCRLIPRGTSANVVIYFSNIHALPNSTNEIIRFCSPNNFIFAQDQKKKTTTTHTHTGNTSRQKRQWRRKWKLGSCHLASIKLARNAHTKRRISYFGWQLPQVTHAISLFETHDSESFAV